MSKIVRLKDNHQLRIALKYVTAKDAPRKNGGPLEYIYTLSSGDVMFLPAMAHQEIQSLKPMAGEAFILAKTIGAGTETIWSVERIPGEPKAEPEPIRKPSVAARSITPNPSIPIPPSLTTRESQRIFLQICATVLAVKAAEEFSISIGRPVVFAPEDIRAMGISGFIEQSRRVA